MKTHAVQTPGDRLDHYLAAQRLCTSRAEAAKLIKGGFVRVGGKVEKPSYAVRVGDLIEVNPPALKTTELTPKKIAFTILYEDSDIVVIDKPAGLVVHPGAGNYEESLVHGLLYHCKDLSGIGGVERPGIVHRLDKGTSGVLVVAKNDFAHQNLCEQFKNRMVKKEYVALLLGSIEKKAQTVVTLIKRAEINRKKFVVNQKKGKRAITHIELIKKTAKVSFISVRIETGRTHQIRVHTSFIGHPILGDETYGGTKKLKGLDEAEVAFVKGLGRPLLHSLKLTFTHPSKGVTMTHEAPMPKDFSQGLALFFRSPYDS